MCLITPNLKTHIADTDITVCKMLASDDGGTVVTPLYGSVISSIPMLVNSYNNNQTPKLYYGGCYKIGDGYIHSYTNFDGVMLDSILSNYSYTFAELSEFAKIIYSCEYPDDNDTDDKDTNDGDMGDGDANDAKKLYIVEAVIPKGCKYYIGIRGDICSDHLFLKEIVQELTEPLVNNMAKQINSQQKALPTIYDIAQELVKLSPKLSNLRDKLRETEKYLNRHTIDTKFAKNFTDKIEPFSPNVESVTIADETVLVTVALTINGVEYKVPSRYI